jgi:hypothetical protein
MEENNINEIVNKWTNLKLIDIIQTLNNINGYIERKKYVNSLKKSINSLFYHELTDFEIQTTTEFVVSEGSFDLMMYVYLELKVPFSANNKRRNIEKVNYGEIMIPKYGSKVIKYFYKTFIHNNEKIEDVEENRTNPSLILAMVFDRLLMHELDSLDLNGKIKISSLEPIKVNDKEFKLKSPYNNHNLKQLYISLTKYEVLNEVLTSEETFIKIFNNEQTDGFIYILKTTAFSKIIQDLLVNHMFKNLTFEYIENSNKFITPKNKQLKAGNISKSLSDSNINSPQIKIAEVIIKELTIF